MEKIRSHRELIVWQKAMDMTVQIYKLVERFPTHERYGLSSQLTRAAASVPANIAEGNARGSSKDYANFLSIAHGSLMETETFLLLAIRLDYVTELDVQPISILVNEVDKMLCAIRAKLLN